MRARSTSAVACQLHPPPCTIPTWQGYSSGGTMLLKLPAYLLEQGERGLRMDGIVAVDAAPR